MDKHTSLTEEQALSQAAEQGLVPLDTFIIRDSKDNTEIAKFDDRGKAEAALEKGQHIEQSRTMVPAEEK